MLKNNYRKVEFVSRKGKSRMHAMLGLCLLLGIEIAQAADCTNGNIVSSTDEDIEFPVNADGTVLDKTTRLLWMRCALGQTWAQASAQCTDAATSYTWVDALMAVKTFNSAGGFAGKNDWRLPNIAELRSIVEDCNSEPAINVSLFPATPRSAFWSSSTYFGLSSNAWLVDFDQGRDNFELKTNAHPIRLVRIAD